jgi:hypothetical protein
MQLNYRSYLLGRGGQEVKSLVSCYDIFPNEQNFGKVLLFVTNFLNLWLKKCVTSAAFFFSS